MSKQQESEAQSTETRLPAPATEDTIAERAYALFRARGGEDGHDVDDWLQAERELQIELNTVMENPLDPQPTS